MLRLHEEVERIAVPLHLAERHGARLEVAPSARAPLRGGPEFVGTGRAVGVESHRRKKPFDALHSVGDERTRFDVEDRRRIARRERAPPVRVPERRAAARRQRHGAGVVLEVDLVVGNDIALLKVAVLLAAREGVANRNRLAGRDGAKSLLGKRQDLLAARPDAIEIQRALRRHLSVDEHFP